MYKNVVNPISLLLMVLIFVLSSCAGTKNRSSYSYKKPRTEKTRSGGKKKRNSKRVYASTHSKRSKIVTTAKRYIGKSYVYGGKTPSTGFDCSGFTSHVFKNNGVDISGPSHQQARKGKKKSMGDLQEGDLVFFGRNNKVSHVAIVANVERNKIEVIHSTSSRGVVIDDITTSDYWQKRYLFGRDVLN